MAFELYEGEGRIKREGVTWSQTRLLKWMQENGERLDLSWNTDTNRWMCLWSTTQMTFHGYGKDPHSAALDALLNHQS